jgi:hypothetical protein
VKPSALRGRLAELRPPAPGPGAPRAVLTSDEKRRRAAETVLRVKLGRAPTNDEIAAFELGGGITACVTPEFALRRVAEAEQKGDDENARRWRSIADGLARITAARRAA